MHKELLATALPGRASKQAPRVFVSMLGALELRRVDQKAVLYRRV